MIWTRLPRERVTSACLGYGLQVAGMPGRVLYRRGPANARTHHLHVVQASTLPTPKQVLLRDNGDDHTRAKTELIQELTDKARAERGLPPTGAWEK
jgi:hypothetical protein